MSGRFEIQRRFRQLWETQDRWQRVGSHETLTRCVEGIDRICFAWDSSRGNPGDYRIVHFDPKGRVKAIHDAQGRLLEAGASARRHHAQRVMRERKLVAA